VTDDYEAGEDLYRVLDPDGSVVGPVPDLDDETLLSIYRDMRLTRHFDARVVSLQRQGRLGTYAPGAGQEGAQVGSTYALRDEDWIVYQYREHGAVAARELLPEYLAYWMGHEAGNAALAEMNVAPLNITIADQIPHAVGMAWAAKLKGDDAVVACHFGDGATSEGDFHEAANFAGVFDVPCVLVCNNNGWAISTPGERQTASATFAGKAAAYGFRGVRVDGMDPLATYEVTRRAAERARGEAVPGDDGSSGGDGDGTPGEITTGDHGGAYGAERPTLIEAVSYRFGAHTTADDPTVYRDDEEVDLWKQRDPLTRMEAFLRETGRLDDERDAAIQSDIEAQVAAIIEEAEAFDPDPASIFDYAFADPTPEIERQRAAFERIREEHGDAAFRRDE